MVANFATYVRNRLSRFLTIYVRISTYVCKRASGMHNISTYCKVTKRYYK